MTYSLHANKIMPIKSQYFQLDDEFLVHFLASSNNSSIALAEYLGQGYFKVSPSVRACFWWYLMRSPVTKKVINKCL